MSRRRDSGRFSLDQLLADAATPRAGVALDDSIAAALTDPETWNQSDAPRNRPDRCLTYLRDRAVRTQRAKELLPEFLRATKQRSWFDVINRDDYRNAEFAREVMTAAVNVRDESPRDSLELMEQATMIAKSISRSTVPETEYFGLLGESHRELAVSLMTRGAYREALTALDDADAFYDHLRENEYHLAVVDLVRAITWQRMKERESDALNTLRSIAPTFERYGDKKRAVKARMAEAIILLFRNEYAVARDLMRAAIEDAEALNDLATVAGLYQNIGLCHRELGDANAAAVAFGHALSLMEELNLRIDIPHVRWGLARLELDRGRAHIALEMLRLARGEFVALGKCGEELSISLEITEMLVAASDFASALREARRLPELFSRAGMLRQAFEAAYYVQQSIDQGVATPAKLRRVRNYVHELQLAPHLPFDPPEGG